MSKTCLENCNPGDILCIPCGPDYGMCLPSDNRYITYIGLFKVLEVSKFIFSNGEVVPEFVVISQMTGSKTSTLPGSIIRIIKAKK